MLTACYPRATPGPSSAGPNPQPKAEEIHPFTQAEIDLSPKSSARSTGPLVVFASETGMRPSEWLAIEWRDVDRDGRCRARRAHVRLRDTKSYGKTARSRRRVPLSTRALEALDAIPRRLDVRLSSPAPRWLLIDLKNFRRAHGSPRSTPPGSRRGGSTTCATRSRPGRSTPGCRSSTSPATWARRVEMIDRTYGHLAQGAERRRGRSWTLPTRVVWARIGPRAQNGEDGGSRDPA